MVLSALLYDTPLLMRSATICGHQKTKSPLYLRDAECSTKLIELHRVNDGVAIIQSAGDGQELIVGANGACFFESPLLGLGEEFKVVTVENGSVVFVSCRTGNVLESDGYGFPHCFDTLRGGWFLLEPSASKRGSEHLFVEVTPVMNLPCKHCQDHAATERREYVMKLVALGKSLAEIDAILLRMYAWPIAEKAIVEGRESEVPAGVGISAWKWMKPE